MWLNVIFTAIGLALPGGQKFYFTVTAVNNVGVLTIDVSDGFYVDLDNPIAGVVYNTDKQRNS